MSRQDAFKVHEVFVDLGALKNIVYMSMN
jgi:hypothetical protein